MGTAALNLGAISNLFPDVIDFSVASSLATVKLKDLEDSVSLDTVFLLRFNEMSGPIFDSSGNIPSTCIFEYNVAVSTGDGALVSAKRFDTNNSSTLSPSYIRIDPYDPRVNVSDDFSYTANIYPDDITSTTTQWFAVKRAVDSNGPVWALGYRDSALHFECYSLGKLQQFDGPGLTGGIDKVGFSVDGDVLTLAVNDQTLSFSLTYVLSSQNCPVYLGIDGVSLTGQYVGIMDDPHMRTSGVGFFEAPPQAAYSTEAPYFEVFDSPVPDADFTPNKVFIDKTTDSTGQLGVQVTPDGGATWFVWDGTWRVNATTENYNTLEETNLHLDEFAEIRELGTGFSQFGLRIFLLSDGRQPIGVTGVSIGSTSSAVPIRVGPNQTVPYGHGFNPFFDSFVLVDQTRDLPGLYGAIVTAILSGAPFVPTPGGFPSGGAITATRDFVTTIDYVLDNSSGQFIDPLRDLRAYPVIADQSIVDPAILIGVGEKSSQVLYTATFTDGSLSGSDSLTITVIPRYIILNIQDRNGNIIPATVSVEDEDENVIISEFSYTALTTVSLLDGEYRLVISISGYADIIRVLSVSSDRHITIMMEEPIEVARHQRLANITVETILVESDVHTVARGDTPTLTFVIRDGQTFLEKDIASDYVIYFAARRQYGDKAVVIDRQCTVDVTRRGYCYVTLSEADTENAGRFRAEVTLIRSGTPRKILTSVNNFELMVFDDIHR